MSEPTLAFAVQTHCVQFAVPCELIKKNIKIIQKQIEKSKKQTTEEIARIKCNSLLTPAEKLSSVKRLIRIYDQLQKKLAAAHHKDHEYRQRLYSRSQRLSQLRKFTLRSGQGIDEKKSTDGDLSEEVLDLHNENLINWYRDEANILIVDYLLKSSTKKDSNLGLGLLKKLEAHSHLPYSKLIDQDIYINYNEVHTSISESHDLEAISTWHNDNRATLKKIGSNLHFEIHYCKYISLIERGESYQATAYSKKHLAPYARRDKYGGDEEFLNNRDRLTRLGSSLVRVSSLAHDVPLPHHPLKSQRSLIESVMDRRGVSRIDALELHNTLLTEDSWNRLSECFTKDYTRVFGISQTYPLFVYLSAGLCSLKTKSCFCNRENTIYCFEKNSDPLGNLDSSSLRDLALRGPNQYYKILRKTNQCPVCSPELFSLSQHLPYAQLITNIYNDPFKLPNGNIYPFDKLLNPEGKFERDNLVRNGKVRDPLTHEIFFIDDCARVFPA